MADDFEDLSLRDYTEKAYLDYSMYAVSYTHLTLPTILRV